MSWVKIDDQFADHPKIVAAGGEAAWLYIAGLCYCQAKLTDGRIPGAVVGRLTDRKSTAKLAKRLVFVGLWEVDGEDFLVHDYHDFNDRAEVVRERIESSRDRLRRWRQSRRNGTCNAQETHNETRFTGVSDTSLKRDGNAKETPTPPRARTATATATATSCKEEFSSPAGEGPILAPVQEAKNGDGRHERTWLTKPADVWAEVIGGKFPAGQAASAFAGIYADGKWPAGFAGAFRRYLQANTGERSQYLDLKKFAGIWKQWLPDKNPRIVC